MDIRNFFAPKGGTKPKSSDSEPKRPDQKSKVPAKAKTPLPSTGSSRKAKTPLRSTGSSSKGKSTSKTSSKSSKGILNSSLKTPAPKLLSSPAKIKPPKHSVSDDEDVEVVPDSDEERTSKKVNGKGGEKDPKHLSGQLNLWADKKGAETANEKQGAVEETPKCAVKGIKPVQSNKTKNGISRTRSVDKNENFDIDDDFSDTEKNSHKKHRAQKDRGSKKQIVISESDDEGENPVKTKAVYSKSHSTGAVAAKEEKRAKGSKRSRVESDEEVQPKKKGQRIIQDSDSDAEERLPAKKGRGRKRKEAVVCLESDEDEETVPRKGSLDAFLTHTMLKANKEPETKKKPDEKQKPVNLTDFFGDGLVTRKERPAPAAVKRKAAETVDKEFHGDDDFTKTLEQLDQMQNKKAKKDTVAEKEGASSCLATKLSIKMKTDSPAPLKDSNCTGVPKTPDKVQSPRRVTRSGSTPRKALSPCKRVSKLELVKSEKTEKRTATPSAPDKHTPSKLNSAEKCTPPKLSPVKKRTPFKPSSVEKKTPPKSQQREDSGDKGSANRNWGAYRNFLNREGPRAPGSKEIPTGADNCLEGLTFVITGVMESLERDEAKSLVERYGGKVTTNISKRTSYLLIGRDPGASKISKAEQCKTKQINEDDLLDLIRTLPGKKSKYQVQAEQADKQEHSLKKAPSVGERSQFTSLKTAEARPAHRGEEDSPPKKAVSGDGETLMWVDKHKPSSLKQIIGQQGDKSNSRKLLMWLQQWHKNRGADIKPTGRFNAQDNGGGFRAALLSGPPGIGKTTTAVLVCKEASFSVVELNASDKRSKRSLKEEVAEALNNQTMVDYVGPHCGPVTGHNHCVIMDEVDGMAGNEDRGGLQELVLLIKTTKIPVITICNDRNSLKMRTLANYCFDLRFQRPRMEQIKGALMSLAFKEGLKISPPAMQEIILSSNQDIRQCIHNLSMWTSKDKELTYDQAKQDAKNAEKDVRLGIFDVSRKIFAGGEETAKMTIHDKSDLFFQDYGFVPLFVHENYMTVTPYAAKGDRKRHLSLLARTADSISQGDLVDRQVRGNGNWSLLPVQAMYASVIPGEYMRGSVSQMIQFPQWLGRNSTTNKNDRILQELRMHMALQITSDKRGLIMDYLPALRLRMTDPLAQLGSEGVPTVIKLMDDYDIIKDDYDNILDISKWPNSKDPLASLDSKTKAAFTRQYNKEGHMTPYATVAVLKKKRGRGGGAGAEEDYVIEEGADEGEAAGPVSDSEAEADDLERDAMINASKKRSKTAKPTATTSKGKGPAKDRGQGKGKGR